MFIYTEFDIIYMFLNERRLKYKPAYALSYSRCKFLFFFVLQVNAP